MHVVLLLAIFALTAVFAVQNEGNEAFRLLGHGWTLPTWVPTTIGVGVVSAVRLLAATHLRLRARLREIGHSREVGRHEQVIEDLLAENARLREQVASLTGEVRGASRPAGTASG